MDKALAFMSVAVASGTTMSSKPMFVLAKDIDKRYAAAANSSKESRTMFSKIVSADAAYEKAVKAYTDVKRRMQKEYGKLGCPTETTLKRREKDIDTAYKLMIKTRKEGLVVARKAIPECQVKSLRSKAQLAEIFERVAEVAALFDELSNALSGK